MNSPTTMDPAPVLGLLPPDPHPVAGCGTCLRLARKRQAARAAGNGSGVSDCNVLIRAHPHGPRRRDVTAVAGPTSGFRLRGAALPAERTKDRLAMTTVLDAREAFPLAPEGGRIPHSTEAPTGPDSRPWILRFAAVPDATQAIAKPPAVYDQESQISIGLYDGPLPFMQTHTPTVPDGDPGNPPPLDEGPKD
ncbi:hypothetical protein ACFY4K_25250 [Streptomyces leeuwenhoekii]|uniref:hypothetical protein n=1 Tax=Streptomyces leeuwenhoekii TaxID=1437453 RepID=UPI003689815E